LLLTEFTLTEVSRALGILAVLVLAAASFRRYIPGIRRLYLPNSVVAGFVGLALGPQLLGALFDESRMSDGLFGLTTIDVWAALPGLLINVVFASILLGKKLPPLNAIWRSSAPQVMFGAMLSFGQYMWGLALALLILVPVFGMSPLTGGLLEISFTGGHGTAAGLSQTMIDLGFPEGPDLALGLATVGLVAGIVVGTLLINRAVSSEKITIARQEKVEKGPETDLGRIDLHDVPEELEPDPATSPLTMTVGAISLAIGLGWLFQELLVSIEVLITSAARQNSLIGQIPLFPFTIIGGAALQVVLSARGWAHQVPRKYVNQASGVALDLLIAAAIATLSLSTIGANAIPFALMATVAVVWSVVAFVYLAPKFYGTRWFERGMGDFGQSSGTVASGFLLINMSDPAGISGASEPYGYKQLLFEPILGGGLITALSLPLIYRLGAGWSLVGATFATLVCLIIGVRLKKSEQA